MNLKGFISAAAWFFCLLVPSLSVAAVINAAGCSLAEVQAAVSSAATGDTIDLPACSATWDAALSIPDEKAVTVRGSGYRDTKIRVNQTLLLNRSGSRITNISFVTGSNIIMLDVKGTGWRIDHCQFHFDSDTGVIVAISANGFNVPDHPVGLIDNCTFINAKTTVNGRSNFPAMSALWARPLQLGDGDAVYIEDNIYTRTNNERWNFKDSARGARVVWRYNTASNGYIMTHGLQADTERSTIRWETYRNVLHSANRQFVPIAYRGGTGVIFDNELSGDYNLRVVYFYLDRTTRTVGAAGLCDGTSLWDGNEDETGWPCRDQIGRGPDAFLFDQDNQPYPRQASVPAYLWQNRDQGIDGQSSDIASIYIPGSFMHIQADRDYYQEQPGFDGTSGVGAGLLADRPAACKAGVAYWATDQGTWNKKPGGKQGVLYRCAATDTWVVYYTPYTYPHPLRAGDDTTAPAAPAGLTVE